jgi:hypothetical protein
LNDDDDDDNWSCLNQLIFPYSPTKNK